MFSKKVGIKESNEIEGLAILEVLRFFLSFFHERLLVESDSLNAISWTQAMRVFGGSTSSLWKSSPYLLKVMSSLGMLEGRQVQ